MRSRNEQIYAKNRQQLAHLLKEHLHVLAIRFRKPCTAALTVGDERPFCSSREVYESAFQISDMCLCQILVFTDKVCRLVPEVLVYMRFDSRSYVLRFANVNGRLAGFRVGSC